MYKSSINVHDWQTYKFVRIRLEGGITKVRLTDYIRLINKIKIGIILKLNSPSLARCTNKVTKNKKKFQRIR